MHYVHANFVWFTLQSRNDAISRPMSWNRRLGGAYAKKTWPLICFTRSSPAASTQNLDCTRPFLRGKPKITGLLNTARLIESEPSCLQECLLSQKNSQKNVIPGVAGRVCMILKGVPFHPCPAGCKWSPQAWYEDTERQEEAPTHH